MIFLISFRNLAVVMLAPAKSRRGFSLSQSATPRDKLPIIILALNSRTSSGPPSM